MLLLLLYIKQPSLLTQIIILTEIFISFSGLVFLLFFVSTRRKRNAAYQKQTKLQTAFQQQLLQAQLEIQEQTFALISQEIHDNVGQSLSLAKVQIHLLELNDVLDKFLLLEAKNNISKALTDLRDIAKSLSADRLHQLHLSEIIAEELNRIGRSGLLFTDIHLKGSEQNLQNQRKLILFRIVQEALQNILKHSKASRVDVFCEYFSTSLQLQIRDNGKGFDLAHINHSEGLGLRNIMKRAALIGGEAHIDSKENKGSTITIITPYE